MAESGKKSGSGPVVGKTKDNLLSMIPSGDEHNRCREALANEGADVNAADKRGYTPLTYAVNENHTQCVNVLIKAGADVNHFSPILLAAARDSAKLVETLIEAGADVNRFGKNGYTASMYAAGMGNTKMLGALLKAGADVNMKDNRGDDALYLAAYTTNDKCLELLLEAGADVNAKTAKGFFPLFAAVKEQLHDNFRCKRKMDFVTEKLNHVKCVNILMRAGADVNAVTPFGTTALIAAAWWGFAKCMKSLLKGGTDVNATDHDGVTALMMASRGAHLECMNRLLDAGADVNATDNNGNNALSVHKKLVYDFSYPKCIKRLLRAGIHINTNGKCCGRRDLGRNRMLKCAEAELNYKRCTDGVMILYSAGQTLEGTAVDDLPKEVKFEDEKFQLKHVCREAIRKHQLKLNPHQHLFGRIPKLGLPDALKKYLLFYVSLDDDDDDDDDDTTTH